MRNIIMDSIGLFIIISGVKSTLESNRDITVLIYLIVGAIIGQIINIDLQIKKLSIFIENKFSRISSISYRNKNSLNSVENEEKEFNFAKAAHTSGRVRRASSATGPPGVRKNQSSGVLFHNGLPLYLNSAKKSWMKLKK